MSVNDIMNYVRKTPGNTNPAVIKSMVESENYGVLEKAQQMDEETLAMAKSYTDSQRIGYIEPPRVLTFDGNAEGKEIFELWVKATEEVIDLNAVEQVVLIDAQSNEEVSISKDALWVEENLEDLGPALMYGEGADSTPAIITVLNHVHQGDGNTISKGTYVLCVGGFTWVSKVKFSEIICPIDPKFLPGVCLPVVEITSAEYPTDGIVELSAEEITQIDNALCLSSLIIFKFKGVFNDLSIMLPVIMSATPFDVEGITAYAMTNESKDKVLQGYPAQNGEPGYWQMGVD